MAKPDCAFHQYHVLQRGGAGTSQHMRMQRKGLEENAAQFLQVAESQRIFFLLSIESVCYPDFLISAVHMCCFYKNNFKVFF